MALLNRISHAEYIIQSEDFEIKKKLRKRQGKPLKNREGFLEDLNSGRLDKYRTQNQNNNYVLYKGGGVLVGHSMDPEKLKNEGGFLLCSPNLTIFKVPKYDDCSYLRDLKVYETSEKGEIIINKVAKFKKKDEKKANKKTSESSPQSSSPHPSS